MINKDRLFVAITVISGFCVALLSPLLLFILLGGISSGKGGTSFIQILESIGQSAWYAVTLLFGATFLIATSIFIISKKRQAFGVSMLVVSQLLFAGAICVIAAVYITGISGTK